MKPIILNGYEISCFTYELANKPLWAVFAKDEIKPRRVFDNITDVWEYCYSQERW